MPRCLLVSSDNQAVKVLTRLLQDLEIEVEHQPDPHISVQELVDNTFEATIVDVDDKAAATVVLHAMRQLPAVRRGLVIVLAHNQPDVYLGFTTGAQIALYKPITVERVALGVRAIRNLISRERRRGAERVPVNIPASLGGIGPKGVPVTIVDLSSGGAAIRGDQHLPASGLFTLHCLLSDTSTSVMFTAEVVWQDAKGRSGIRFVNVASASRQILNQWLKSHTGQLRPKMKLKAAASRK